MGFEFKVEEAGIGTEARSIIWINGRLQSGTMHREDRILLRLSDGSKRKLGIAHISVNCKSFEKVDATENSGPIGIVVVWGDGYRKMKAGEATVPEGSILDGDDVAIIPDATRS